MLIRAEIPQALPSPNRTHSRHWAVAAERRRLWAWYVKLALIGQVLPAEPIRYAYVRIERHSSGGLDIDNLYASAKAVLDVLQPFGPRRPLGLGIIAGDDSKKLNLEVVNVLIGRGVQKKTIILISESPLTEYAVRA